MTILVILRRFVDLGMTQWRFGDFSMTILVPGNPTGNAEKFSITLFHETPFLRSVVAQSV